MTGQDLRLATPTHSHLAMTFRARRVHLVTVWDLRPYTVGYRSFGYCDGSGLAPGHADLHLPRRGFVVCMMRWPALIIGLIAEGRKEEWYLLSFRMPWP